MSQRFPRNRNLAPNRNRCLVSSDPGEDYEYDYDYDYDYDKDGGEPLVISGAG